MLFSIQDLKIGDDEVTVRGMIHMIQGQCGSLGDPGQCGSLGDPGQCGSLGDPGQCGSLGHGKHCTWNKRCRRCLKQGYTSRISSKL